MRTTFQWKLQTIVWRLEWERNSLTSNSECKPIGRVVAGIYEILRRLNPVPVNIGQCVRMLFYMATKEMPTKTNFIHKLIRMRLGPVHAFTQRILRYFIESNNVGIRLKGNSVD